MALCGLRARSYLHNMCTPKRLLTIAIAVLVASTAFGVAANAEEPPSSPDDLVVASLAAEAGISHEEAARRLETQEASAILAERLTAHLGDGVAGSYLDRDTGNLIVNVLDERVSEEVRAAGAIPRTVRYSLADLEEVASQLDPNGEAGRAGHAVSIGVDVETNSVVVTIPESAPIDQSAARFLDHVRSFGDRTEIQVSRDPLLELAYNIYAGGHLIKSTLDCTAGLTARDANNYRYMFTAQHCVRGNQNVTMFGQFFGKRWYSDPAHDTATILNYSPATFNQLPRVWYWSASYYVTVKGSLTTLKNSYVCKSGMTTGRTCGYVTGTGVRVWAWQLGIYIWNLTTANICSRPGDSGGPVVVKSGSLGYWWATGITSLGEAAPCSWSSKMAFVPIAAALQHTGLTLVTG